MKYIFTYKTTNLINGKTYIGVHSTNILDDGYAGSGKILTHAINRYGESNFKREILDYFDTVEDAYERESELVNEDWVSKTDTYNIALGGRGGDLGNDVNLKISNTVKTQWVNGKYKDVDYSSIIKHNYNTNPNRRIKLSESLRKYYKTNDRYNKGMSPSKETKNKLSNKTYPFWELFYKNIDRTLLQFSNKGIFIKEWDNIIIASNELQIKQRKLYSALTNKLTNTDFIWEYK